MRLANEIVVPSGYLVDVSRRFGFHARAILSFVDLDRLDYRERSTVSRRVLSNRNLEPMYNVACSLRAFAIVQQQHADARLAVVGDGSQRKELERLASNPGLRNVTFVGKVLPDRMREYYSDADIYLNSPNIDNMPHSVIEAFAAGH